MRFRGGQRLFAGDEEPTDAIVTRMQGMSLGSALSSAEMFCESPFYGILLLLQVRHVCINYVRVDSRR